jgi:hypothetical protein
MKNNLQLATIILLQIQFANAQKITPFTTPKAAGFYAERLQRLDITMNGQKKNG